MANNKFKYSTTSKAEVITESKVIVKQENLNSIFFKNDGDVDCRVFDAVLLTPGELFAWSNHPDVLIDENIQVTFTAGAGTKRLTVFKQFIQQL